MSHTPVPEKLSPQYIPYMPSMGEAPLLGLIKTVDQLIDWAHSIEKWVGEQPSDRELTAEYITRESAETARKMLLGNVE